MNIAFDISPLLTGHKYRGIGFYTENLLKNLEKHDRENHYFKLANKQEIPKNINLIHHNNFDVYRKTLKPFQNVKNLITIHDLTLLKFPKHFPAGFRGKINWFFQKQALQKFDAVITDSISSKKDIVQIARIPEEKIHVVYLAASDQFRKLTKDQIQNSRVKKKHNLPENYILYVGDVNWNKNVINLIKSFSHIKRIFPDLKLVLIGKAFLRADLEEAKEISQIIRKSGLERDIFKIGFVSTEDLVVIYNLAKVYVQPSYYEGFGLPVLEAMSCGVPVVCSNQGSLPEISGDACIKINPYDLESLTSGIKKILEADEQYFQFIEKGLEQAKKFSWKKTAFKTIEVYKNI